MALKWKSELDLESNLSYCDNDQKSNDINLNLTLGWILGPGHVLEPVKLKTRSGVEEYMKMAPWIALVCQSNNIA